MIPTGPKDGQPDRKASRAAERRVGRTDTAPGPAVLLAFCPREVEQTALWGPLDTPRRSVTLTSLSSYLRPPGNAREAFPDKGGQTDTRVIPRLAPTSVLLGGRAPGTQVFMVSPQLIACPTLLPAHHGPNMVSLTVPWPHFPTRRNEFDPPRCP